MATAVATKTATNGDVVQISPAVLTRIAELAADAPREQATLGDLLARIMDCETIDQAATLFDGMDNSKDVAGRELMFDSFILRESSYDNDSSLPFYMTVFARDYKTQEPVTFNTGATTVMITLLQGHKHGWFPFTGRIELKQLDNGNTACNLVFSK